MSRHTGRAPLLLSAGAGLVGVVMMITGAVSTARHNELMGAPHAATHDAARPSGMHVDPAAPPLVIARDSTTTRATPTPTPTMPTTTPRPPQPPTAKPAPRTSADHPSTAHRPNRGQRGTIRLPDGDTARLVHSHVTAGGALAIPDGVREASWWGASFGARHGATVVAGHVNWAGEQGPFAALWHTHPGDTVSVVDAEGHAHTYRVTNTLTLGKNELPEKAPELFAQSGPHRVVLVTCGGKWVGGELGYASNRIAVAEPVNRPT